MTTYTSLGDRPLQHFYSIDIVDDGESQKVFFNSTIHVNRRVELPTSYGRTYTHAKILRDSSLIRQINDRYGRVTKPDAEAPF